MSIVLSAKLHEVESAESEYGQELVHFCPGCNHRHIINITKPNHCNAMWGWNGDATLPTFTPSIHIKGICHYFIIDGRIQFLADSNHHLAGQTVDLPDIPRSHNVIR